MLWKLIQADNFCRLFDWTIGLRSDLRTVFSDIEFVGVRYGRIDSIEMHGKWPLLKLSADLKKAEHFIPNSIYGRTVLQRYLDPYMHSAVAQDGLGGIGKGFLEICFIQVKRINGCYRFEAWLCSEMKEVVLSPQNALFNYRKEIE